MDDRYVKIRCFECAAYHLMFPHTFLVLALAKQRKIFEYLFRFRSDYSENKTTIALLDTGLPALVEEEKAAWDKASIAYQNGYQNTDPTFFGPELGLWKEADRKKEVNKRKRANAQLLTAVKKAKAQYEKALSVQELYEAEKQKYCL